jgi:hypothetical protein
MYLQRPVPPHHPRAHGINRMAYIRSQGRSSPTRRHSSRRRRSMLGRGAHGRSGMRSGRVISVMHAHKLISIARQRWHAQPGLLRALLERCNHATCGHAIALALALRRRRLLLQGCRRRRSSPSCCSCCSCCSCSLRVRPGGGRRSKGGAGHRIRVLHRVGRQPKQHVDVPEQPVPAMQSASARPPAIILTLWHRHDSRPCGRLTEGASCTSHVRAAQHTSPSSDRLDKASGRTVRVIVLACAAVPRRACWWLPCSPARRPHRKTTPWAWSQLAGCLPSTAACAEAPARPSTFTISARSTSHHTA